MAQNRVLILFGHPAVRKSRVNRLMAEAVAGIPGVRLRDLYEIYPDFVINVREEQELLRANDLIVFQHPFYWYSMPAIFKEWFDLVLEYGFAYGEGGTALRGKRWMNALTTGGQKSAYCREGHNHFTVRQLLAPVEQTAHLCGMEFLEPYVIYGTHQMDRDKAIPQAVAAYRARIEELASHAR
jgi:glutathione-regulated potassium-efflux system ancillary protein KefG